MNSVEEIMTKNPICCTPDTNLVDVARLMMKFDCGEIPVVDSLTDKKIIGVITDRDICCRIVAEGLNPLSMCADECMSSPAIIITKSTSIDDCCLIMEENQIRRLPVVDENQNCCGMVSLADIVRWTDKGHVVSLMKNLSQPSSNIPIYVS